MSIFSAQTGNDMAITTAMTTAVAKATATTTAMTLATLYVMDMATATAMAKMNNLFTKQIMQSPDPLS